MKKTFKLEDLDCANCAAKMENAIKKLDGVKDATVSFMTQKMTIEADDERFDEVVKAAVKCIAKVEPDCLEGARLRGAVSGHRLGRALGRDPQHRPRPGL